LKNNKILKSYSFPSIEIFSAITGSSYYYYDGKKVIHELDIKKYRIDNNIKLLNKK